MQLFSKVFLPKIGYIRGVIIYSNLFPIANFIVINSSLMNCGLEVITKGRSTKNQFSPVTLLKINALQVFLVNCTIFFRAEQLLYRKPVNECFCCIMLQKINFFELTLFAEMFQS